MDAPVRQFGGIASAFKILYPEESKTVPFREFRKHAVNRETVSKLQLAIKNDLKTHAARMEEWKSAHPKAAKEYDAAHIVKPRKRGGKRKHVPMDEGRPFKQLCASSEKADIEKLIVKYEQDVQMVRSSVAVMNSKLDKNKREADVIRMKLDQMLKCMRELGDTFNVLVVGMNNGAHQSPVESEEEEEEEEEEEDDEEEEDVD